jgi:hypothetical protein
MFHFDDSRPLPPCHVKAQVFVRDFVSYYRGTSRRKKSRMACRCTVSNGSDNGVLRSLIQAPLW